MGVPLPRVLGVLSDATKLKFSNINLQLAETIYLPVIVEDFANLNAWTESDPSNKINLSGGEISFDGANSTTLGIFYTAGIARANGYLELKIKYPGDIPNALFFCLSPYAAVSYWNSAYIRTIGNEAGALSLTVRHDSYPLSWGTSIVASTYYTVRMYIGKSNNGTSWKKMRCTIQSPASSEIELCAADAVFTEHAATIYPFISRYTASPTLLSYVKEFRWYSGYATDAPYVEYIHDAGVGLAFDNFDLTAFAMPGTVPTTNLTFAYSFDDGTPSYSAALTLANLQAVGKLTARHRYIRMRVYANSDGATLVYVDKPNSDTATDGIGVDVDAEIAAYQAANNSAPTHGDASLIAPDTCKVDGIMYNGNQLTEFHTPAQVIHSAGGDWIDEEVLEGTLRQGSVAGVAGAIVGKYRGSSLIPQTRQVGS